MAIIVHDEIMTDFDISLPNLIATCQSHYSVSRCVIEGVTKYRVASNVVYKTTQNSNKPVKYESIHVDVLEADLTSNLFVVLYNELKSRYQSTEDIL